MPSPPDLSRRIAAPTIIAAVKPAKIFFAIAFTALLTPPAHAQHCPVPAAAGRAVVDPDAPLQLRAGRMVSEDRDTVTLHGDAELRQGPRKFTADHITYNREKREVNAAGGVTVRSAAGDILRADEARVELHNFTGEAAAVDYAAGGGTGRGRASHAELRGRGVLVLEDAAYTQCPPGNDDVVLTAAQITLDAESGFGVAKHAKLRFKNVPVFYLPRLSFPISDRRKSGFLFPSAGYDGDSGLVVEAPLYLNLHPSADATVTPAVHTARGAQLALEARYLVPGGGGELHGAGLPNDDALQQRDRWAVDYRHRHRFTDHLQGALDYRDVSDNFYLGDFADGIAASSATTLPASAELKYDDGRWRARAGTAAYTVVDNNVAADDFPYDKRPYIQLSGHSGTTLGALRTEYGVHTSLVHFKRGHGTEGRRLRARPALHFPLRGRGGFLIPALSLDYTRYHIDDGGDGSGQTLSRTVPLFSVDGALVFERGAGRFVHTLEPRVFYVLAKNKTQDGLPLFDTSKVRGDNYEQLFRDNLFFGGDRIGDANRISLGVESRLLAGDGAQVFRAAIGQMFHLRRPRVGLSPGDSAGRRSGLVGEAGFTKGAWRGGAFAVWNSADDRLRGGRLRLGVESDAGNGAEVGYHFRRAADADSEDGAVRQWRLRAWRQLSARWRVTVDEWYSVEHSRNAYADLAFTYDNCCWGITVRGRQRLSADGDSRNSLLASFRLRRFWRYNRAQ